MFGLIFNMYLSENCQAEVCIVRFRLHLPDISSFLRLPFDEPLLNGPFPMKTGLWTDSLYFCAGLSWKRKFLTGLYLLLWHNLLLIHLCFKFDLEIYGCVYKQSDNEQKYSTLRGKSLVIHIFKSPNRAVGSRT